ncbi:MAG TPA: hypothetical protein VLD67_05275 [Vicinamibacterales bacterium]|nr:hypothetical protein [Vicinamibacterales bacterium]
MSVEVLVLVALFLLLPLVERLLRSARQQNKGAAEMPRPASQPSMSVGTGTPQPRPLVDARVQRTVDVSPMAASPPVRSLTSLQPTAPGSRHAARRAVAVDHLQSLPTLRGAVVLMTILAPCLSVAPHWAVGVPVPRSTARG